MRDGKAKKGAGGGSSGNESSVRSKGGGKTRDLFAEDANRSVNMHSDPLFRSTSEEDFFGGDRYSSASAAACSPGYFSDRSASTMNYSQASSADSSPFSMSPWNNQPTTNPFFFSANGGNVSAVTAANPEEKNPPMTTDLFPPGTGLVGSLVREEGHIYSLAATRDLLYTGSDSKNIRVWKDQKEFSGFKSSSGLVKAILVSSDNRVFTGHQDGKIRVWKVSPKNPRVHKRVGTLPRLKDFLKCSMKPSNYVDVRRKHQRSAVWIKHSDAVSCLCLSEDENLLYSGSWDRTLKVWRLEDLRCIESFNAHDDAVNAVTAAFGRLVFTGSADGTVKVWRREDLVKPGKGKSKGLTRHVEAQTLVRLEVAVTALAINVAAGVVYGGSSDGGVSWWDRGLMNGAATGRSEISGASGVLQGHKVAVLCLAAAGSFVFSGSADATISVWRRDDTGLHTCLSVLTGHAGPVKCLAVAADPLERGAGGRWVVYSGSLDKSIKVWKVADAKGGASNGATAGDGTEAEQAAAGTGNFGHPDAPRFDMF